MHWAELITDHSHFLGFDFFASCTFCLLLLATVDAGHRCVGRRKQGLMAQYLVAIPP